MMETYKYPTLHQQKKKPFNNRGMTLRFDSLPPLSIPLGGSSSASSTRSDRSFSSSSRRSDVTDATEIFSPSQHVKPSNALVRRPHLPSKPAIKVILGTASFGSAQSVLGKISTSEDAAAFLDSFRARGYLDVDTARAYPVGRGGTAEALLGSQELRLGSWANVSTKVSSFMPGSHRARNLESSINRSLAAMNVEATDIMYLHAPDRATCFEETCGAMNKAYQEGKFERFGLSNYSIADVEEIVAICERNDWVKPTVYQGQYNPICRGAENELFATLRKHHIVFYAYSPSACGFFSGKVSRASRLQKGSRWNVKSPLGAKYSCDYFHDALFSAAAVVRHEAAKHGISGHAAALRWTVWHSDLEAENGDGVIVGASTLPQLEENLDILEQGPLPARLLQVVESAWEDIRYIGKGPRFHFI